MIRWFFVAIASAAVIAWVAALVAIFVLALGPWSEGGRPCGRSRGEWDYVGYVERDKPWEIYSDSLPTSDDGRLITFKAACWQREGEKFGNVNLYDSDLVGDFVVDQARDSLLIFGPERRGLYGR